MKKITVIGGGTGTFVVLSALKDCKLNLAVIVNMTDSGGSTGKLRDQLGVLPPGDLRQCLVALSDAPLLWRKLFLYRFEKGDLAGHNFGNIFLSALEKISKNYQQVIETVSFVLKTRGLVIPVTFAKSHLCVRYKNGKILKGEGKIDVNFAETSGIAKAFLEPEVKANPQAIKRIKQSDYILIGPGDLYTTIIPILLIKGIARSICQSKAKIIYIMNLMTKSGQTTDYTASDHLDDIYKYLGRYPDYVIINNSQISQKIIDWYQRNNEKVVKDNLDCYLNTIKKIRADIVDNRPFIKEKADEIPRSILRHDPKKLTKVLLKIFYD